MRMWPFVLLILGLSAVLPGCRQTGPTADSNESAGLRRVVMQTDWLPQAEHGGFYQALVRGFYEEEGLDVELLPGGINAQINLKVARGDVDFGMHRSDVIFADRDRDLPLVVVAANFQRDPQALLIHESNPVNSFADLDGRTVIATPSMVWIPHIKKRFGIDFDLRPLTYGLQSFLSDPSAIQQCFVTNEPFFARQQGARVKVLMISDSGYESYHVIFTRLALLREDPDVVRRFVRATMRGWKDYLEGDPSAAHAEILRRNAQMTPELLAYSRGELIARQLVLGNPAEGDVPGRLRVTRVEHQLEVLRDAGVIRQDWTPDQLVWPEALVREQR